jgi:hypothetical protein
MIIGLRPNPASGADPLPLSVPYSGDPPVRAG